jgi:translation initiation factor IF-2
MPVRIYDIAKKLGIESKDVLVKAKELGIAGAKVPSSSLDKITAEYLEEQLGGKRVAIVQPPPTTPEPIVIVSAPPPVPPPAAEPVLPQTETTEANAAPAEPPPVPPQPVVPPPPPPPRLGEKVGFIQLPQKPAPKIGAVKPPPRPVTPPRPGRPGDRPGFVQPHLQRFPGKPDGKVPVQPTAPETPKFVPPSTGEVITLKPPIVVRELAERLNRKPFQLIADLMELGVFANVNQAIDEDIAQRLCAKYGFRFEVEKRERGGGIVHAPQKPVEKDIEDKPEEMKLRAPVVTIMGHVDHGKTTLLDVIRKTNVAAKEAGGITQHIGAYTISIPHPERKSEMQQITFLDTPGHAAFSSMRARGANVTDIVILVVASNDGVMPQTLEALSHAQAAKVPIIVAVNKCDHPNANPMKVRQQLQDKGLVCEEWGGNTIFVDVSALTKQGVDKLLEMIVLQADVLELKANPTRAAKGNVIESGLEPGGPTATVLVRKGTLHLGDIVICGQYWGKVRALINEEGRRLQEAGLSVAVKVLGLNGVPEAGLEFSVVDDEKHARALAEERAEKARGLDQERRPKVTLENLFDTLAAESSKTLRIVVKGDTQGSVEAIVEALRKIETEKVSLDIIHSAVGTVTESDVLLASVDEAIVLGFHTRIDNGVSDVAKREGVQIKLYSIIYELIDQVKEAMTGLLDPLTREVVVGSAEVRKVFALSKGGNVAGCVVASGRLVKGKMRVQRRKGLIFEGVSLSLRRFQDEVNDVRAGMECGIRLDGFNDFQVGDVIECYTLEKVPQKL